MKPSLPFKSNTMTVLDTIWFTNITTKKVFGIVKAEDPTTKEIKFYIGEGKGGCEKTDKQYIIDWGTKIKPENMLDFFKADKTPGQLKGQKAIKFDRHDRE